MDWGEFIIEFCDSSLNFQYFMLLPVLPYDFETRGMGGEQSLCGEH